MNRSEFLSQLEAALQGNMPAGEIRENIVYYSNYIEEEIRNGKSETEVLEMLGDPWIIAKTLTDVENGTDRETVYEAGGQYQSSEEQRNPYGQGERLHVYRLDTWWKKLLLILGIVMIVLLVITIIAGVLNFLAPVLVPLLIIMIVVRLIGGRRG